MMLTQIRKLNSTFPAFFRHRPIKDKVLITSLTGDFLLLTQQEFQAFAEGNVAKDSELYARLRDGNFIRSEFNQAKAVEALRARKSFLNLGPILHVMVVTLRCNETCVYCHASRAEMDAVHTDMTPEIAEKAVDFALRAPSPSITFEFQGGEPLVNFPVMKHIIEYALKRNKQVGKQIEFTLVTNLALMDEEKLKYLIDNRVQICTSIDGPEHLHDKQRKLPGLSAYKSATHWIKRINKAYEDQGLDTSLYHVEALLTTTRETLQQWKAVVDTYVDLGCKAIFLRPVDPFGFADRTGPRIEYPRKEYMEFYRNAVDYMIDLNKKGVQVLERFAAIFLTKILAGHDPNYLDIRNPHGSAIGQIAYNYDGKMVTCDEGRMLHEMGDSTFLLGNYLTDSYRSLMSNETIRALTIASNLDGQPDCVNCAYNPYCGVQPIHSYKTQGTIFGRMRESTLCTVHKGIQDYLFEKMVEGDPEVMAVFKRWTTIRDRTHFLQNPEGQQSSEAEKTATS